MQGANLCFTFETEFAQVFSTQCDVPAGHIDIPAEWNKLEKITQNFQEERASCDQQNMALCDRNISVGCKSSSTIWSLTAVPPHVLKDNQMSDV